MDLVTDRAYGELLDRVRGQVLAGLERVRRLVERETTRLYWEIGGSVGDFLKSVGKSYGHQVVSHLASDTEISTQILYDAVRFRTLFPNFPTWGNLSWSHYRIVLPVLTGDARIYYLTHASENEWSVRKLMEQVKDGAFERMLGIPPGERAKEETVSTRLHAKRGEPYIYRVTEKWETLVLDLGFRASHPMPEAFADIEPGTIVRSRAEGRYEDGYRVERADLRARIYAFRATVARIIDGDTLWATVDLGFSHWTDVKLRLRGIDTEEIATAGGLRARDYLINALSDAGDFVVTSTKVDLYDRYLADLFVLPGEVDPAIVAREGVFLNRQMLDDDVARLWTDKKPPEF